MDIRVGTDCGSRGVDGARESKGGVGGNWCNVIEQQEKKGKVVPWKLLSASCYLILVPEPNILCLKAGCFLAIAKSSLPVETQSRARIVTLQWPLGAVPAVFPWFCHSQCPEPPNRCLPSCVVNCGRGKSLIKAKSPEELGEHHISSHCPHL